MAHLTNFSFEFFYKIFTEDASLRLLYHCAKKSKMTKNSNQGGGGGPALRDNKAQAIHARTTVLMIADLAFFLKDNLPFLKDNLSFLKDNLSFLKDNLSFLKDNLSFLKNNPSFLKDNLSFLKDNLSFLKDNLSFLKDNLSFLKDNLSFLKDMCNLSFRKEARNSAFTPTSAAVLPARQNLLHMFMSIMLLSA